MAFSEPVPLLDIVQGQPSLYAANEDPSAALRAGSGRGNPIPAGRAGFATTASDHNIPKMPWNLRELSAVIVTAGLRVDEKDEKPDACELN
jgi:hypothetical protein